MKSLCSMVVVLAAALDAQPNRMSPLVFSHVAIVDTASASVLPDMTVVITEDHIADVGQALDITPPAGARVVDGRGQFLIPGLWDMHVHTFAHNPRSTNGWLLPLLIANGVTGARDMWTTADDFPQVARFRKGLADGSLLVPRYGAVGWLVDGPDPIWPNSDVVSTPQAARDFVGKVKAAQIDFVKVYTKLRSTEYFAIRDEARKLGIPFAGHVPDAVSASAASDAGQRSIEHLRNVDLGCSSKEEELLQSKTWGPEQAKEMRDTYDEQKCAQLGQRFARNQTWQVPTFVVQLASHSSLGQPALGSDPRLKYVPASARTRWNAQISSRAGASDPQHGLGPAFENRLHVVATIAKAGAPIMAGTDVPNPYVYPGFSLHDELALFCEAGLTPGQALQTATYNPAKFLGRLDRLGTVEKGKFADLVLLDANPLDDIRNTQKIRAVVLNGRYLDRAALDKLLADAAAAAAIR